MSNRGRPRTSTRIFEHNCHSLDAADFRKQPNFKPEFRYEFLPDEPDPILHLSVAYRWNDGSTTSVELTTTRPNYGGTRYWYVCPHCRRRVRKLYTGSDSGSIACRRCFGLVYDSQYRKGAKFAMFRWIRKQVEEVWTT